MKQCKQWISILLIWVLLISCCACTQQSGGTTGSAASWGSTQTPPTTDSSSTTETTQPLDPVWPGYVDAKTEYTYYYESGHAREWEEDILYFANNMLTEHPMLLNENWIVRLPNYGSTGDNFYDPQVKEEMLRQINALIPMLEELSDEQIIDRLKKIMALFHDVHTRVEYYETDYFPIAFMPIYEEASWVYYTIALPRAHEALLYTQLTAINGYPLQQVIDMLRPYIRCETEWALHNKLAGGGISSNEYLSTERMLKAAGTMEEADTTATYTLRHGDGQSYDLKLEAASAFPQDTVGTWADAVFTVPLTGRTDRNYWLSEDLAENTLYVRFNSFTVQPEYTYLQLSADINKAYLSRGSYEKVIVDLRFNGGGYTHSGYEGLISLFGRMQCEEFYVLINGGSYSKSIIFAAELLTIRGENALLVGQPSGEAGGFFAAVWSGEYVMPNSEVEFTIPTEYFLMFPMDDGGDIIPDVPVYQTIEDYQKGIDTVLAYVLSQ